MNKPLYLPFSARSKYEHCPKLYFLHYKERLRPAEITATLLFGTAVDSAAEEYLKTRNRELCRQKFKDLWHEQEQDGQKIEISNSVTLQYAAADFDAELLTESDNQSIIKDTVYATVSDLVKDGKEPERIAWAKWISMFYKGRLMLRGFMDWVDANVEEVLGTQVPIELENEEGDKVPGLADFVIKVKGYDKPILVDLKTSARYYDRNSVKESEQLALYYFYLSQTKYPDMERAAYLVLNKQIKKNRKKTCKKCGAVTTGREQTCAEGGKGKNRCNGDFLVDISPEAVVQYIHDEIPERFIQDTISKFNISAEGIKAERFEPCWTACESYYGRRCPYYDYCRSGSTQGLIRKPRASESSVTTDSKKERKKDV
jgi:hypothetical protein